MINNLWAIVLVTMIPWVYHVLVGAHRGWFNVDGLFVAFQWVMAVGTLSFVDLDLALGRLAASLAVVPFLMYVSTSCLLAFARRKTGPERWTIEVIPVDLRRNNGLIALFALSAAVTVAYFWAVGYNVLYLGLSSAFSGASNDYTTLRLNSYASSNYLFPGYVNQFKNVILPSLSLVVVHAAFMRRSPMRRWVAVALSAMCVFALLGTGQRGAFVLFGVTAIVFLRYVNPTNFRRQFALLGASMLPLLVAVTLLLGRSSSALAGASGVTDKIVVLLRELGKRFFYDNQYSGYAALEYLSTRPTVWGSEWLQAVLGVLPSNPGSPLAREVFAFLYGSDRGTAPISMWGSVYYNWEWPGLFVMPAVLAVLFDQLVRLQFRKRQINSLELVGIAGVAAVAGTWVAGGPEQLLNAGAVTSAVLWFMGARLAMNHQTSAEDATSEDLRPKSRTRRSRSHRRDARFVTTAGPPRLGVPHRR